MTANESQSWSTYPCNLRLPAAELDAKDYDRRLARAEKQLFVEDNENEAGVLEIGPVCQVFFLYKPNSWAQLQVSAEFLRKLFTFLHVHPEFLDIVFLFGEKRGPVEQSFSSFFSHCRPRSIDHPVAEAACSYDIGYNVKYVAQHGQPYPKDPFSVRETGVYHSFDADTQQAQWIFIQASGALQGRLEGYFAMAAESQADAQVQIHGMIFQCASQAWRDYLVYLEGAFSQLVTPAFFSNVKGPQQEGDIEADFADIRRLQKFADKLECLLQVLQRNIDIAQEVKTFLRRAQKLSPSCFPAVFEDTEGIIDSSILQHRVHSSRIQSLISRAHGTSMLVQNMLDLRASDSSAEINIRIHQLAEKSARETKSMSIFSLISAIFLPAMFLAVGPSLLTLFGTNFFSYANGKIHIASNFWIYIVLAAAMSGITVLLWVLYQRNRKLKMASRRMALEDGLKKA
ncbi:hypothetical protein BDW59DRAFT_174470 [Aspergillus cavernicola]|uniref:CorA-like transporter domain-containing protein n=1 Tax=Aspergillus cavernicola TaxID=176166 RepID=A0ABR4HYJ4_9EURO